MVDAADPQARQQRLARYKRIGAPLRAALIIAPIAWAAGAFSLPQPVLNIVALAALFGFFTLERATIPACPQRWRSDRRSKGGLVLAFLIAIGVAVAERGRGPLLEVPHFGQLILVGMGYGFIVTGVILRQWAMRTLGPLFTDRARILDAHQLVTTGPFATVRHPAYAGLAMVYLGFPLAVASLVGLGVALLLLPPALAYRIRVEEQVLEDHFGAQWLAYARVTPRLIPRPASRRAR